MLLIFVYITLSADSLTTIAATATRGGATHQLNQDTPANDRC